MNLPTTEAEWDERSRKYYSNLDPQPSEEFFQQAKEWEIKHGRRLCKFTDQELALWKDLESESFHVLATLTQDAKDRWISKETAAFVFGILDLWIKQQIRETGRFVFQGQAYVTDPQTALDRLMNPSAEDIETKDAWEVQQGLSSRIGVYMRQNCMTREQAIEHIRKIEQGFCKSES